MITLVIAWYKSITQRKSNADSSSQLLLAQGKIKKLYMPLPLHGLHFSLIWKESHQSA